jgi:hypothetical protein
MATLYYTCLNNHCAKHRNIFIEGDPEHAHCRRERLYLEGERAPLPRIALLFASLALLTLSVSVVALARSSNRREPKPSITGDEPASESRPYENYRTPA